MHHGHQPETRVRLLIQSLPSALSSPVCFHRPCFHSLMLVFGSTLVCHRPSASLCIITALCSDYCEYHVQAAHSKFRNGRMALQAP